MPYEEQLEVGAALLCGTTRLVPIVRVGVHAFGEIAASLEVELVGILVAPRDRAPSFLAVGPAPAEMSWTAWLEARPELLRNLNARLSGSPQAGSSS